MLSHWAAFINLWDNLAFVPMLTLSGVYTQNPGEWVIWGCYVNNRKRLRHKRSLSVCWDITLAAVVVSEHLPGESRATKRWTVAAVVSACVCALWFAYVNRDGCWFYWNRTRGLTGFALLWLWLLLLFGLRLKGRFVLVAFTLFILYFSQIESSHVAAAESSAVGTLREYRSAIESDKVERRHSSYPPTLPNIVSAYPLRRAYRFQYTPSVSASGSIDGYVIKATPLRRSCGCTRSFTIANDGRLYYTMEERAATFSDESLQ
jgi:hypothetical protein